MVPRTAASKPASGLRARWPSIVLVHTPVHASWLNQIEIYFSIVQRKVLTPNDFVSLVEVEERLLGFQQRYQQIAKLFRSDFHPIRPLQAPYQTGFQTFTPHGSVNVALEYVTVIVKWETSERSTVTRGNSEERRFCYPMVTPDNSPSGPAWVTGGPVLGTEGSPQLRSRPTRPPRAGRAEHWDAALPGFGLRDH